MRDIPVYDVITSQRTNPRSPGALVVGSEHSTDGVAVPVLLVNPEGQERGDLGIPMGGSHKQASQVADRVEFEVVLVLVVTVYTCFVMVPTVAPESAAQLMVIDCVLALLTDRCCRYVAARLSASTPQPTLATRMKLISRYTSTPASA